MIATFSKVIVKLLTFFRTFMIWQTRTASLPKVKFSYLLKHMVTKQNILKNIFFS